MGEPTVGRGEGFGLLKPRVSFKMHNKVQTSDILSFFQQLSTLFNASTPIYDSIVIAGQQSQSQKLREVIAGVAKLVAAGSALSDALGSYPDHFIPEWVETIRSGENSGKLGEVLRQLTKQIDRSQQLRSKLISAMIYPTIIMIVAALCLTILIVKVVPTFAGMFQQTGQKLPEITRAVLDLSEFLGDNGIVIGLGIVASIWATRRYVRTPAGRELLHRALVGLPIIGEITVLACMQRFANNTALLLRAGVQVNEALVSLAGIFNTNVVYQRAMIQVRREVERGGTVSDAAEGTGVFTSLALSMIRIGEESGTLPQVLDEVEEFYRRKLETVVERFFGSLETLVILFMGVTVAVVLCAIYLPMFSMAGGVG